MLKALSRNLGRYLRHELGVAAIIFAIMLPAIVASAGVAVDLAVAYNSQNRLANALDKALLAAASSSTLSSAALQTRFLAFFNANYPAGKYGTPINPTLTVNSSTNTMSATASATVPTSFMNIFGISSLTINAASTVVETLAGVEAVLVLDTTGSMAGNNIAALRTASTDFINVMFSSITDPKYLKIGIVPWSDTVNVGSYGWGLQSDLTDPYEGGTVFAQLQTPDPYGMTTSNITYVPSGTTTGNDTNQWWGCVTEPNAASITSDSTTMWNMYRYPSGNCTQYQCISCPGSGYTLSGSTCSKTTTSHGNTTTTTENCTTNSTCIAWQNTPNENCTSVPVLPMTNNQSALLAEINALPTANNTYPDIGMVWGWRMISPNFPFEEGTSYSDPTWSKTVIMMTDGNATINTVMSGEGAYNTPGTSQTSTDQNNFFEQTCTNMKAQGIRIYTITFQSAINETTMGYYQDCATNPSMYFNAPTNADLTTAFQAIATQLGQLHLTQ
jgi:Flp pilus assembly protein TadG